MALMQFVYKVKNIKGDVFDIFLWGNNLKDVEKYLVNKGLTIVEDLNTLDCLSKKAGKEE